MAERGMDTRSSAAFLRHRWRLLLTGGLVGAVVGLLYAVLVPVELTSTSLVSLQGAVQSPTGGGTDIDSQVLVVKSRPIMEQAGKAVRPALSAARVTDSVTVEAPTAQLIQIQASSSRAGQAEALSQAVATAYVRTISDTARIATATTVAELKTREERLNREILALQEQIDAIRQRRKQPGRAGTPADDLDAQLLSRMTVDQIKALPSMHPGRADVVTAGALIATRVGARLGVTELVVSESDILDGIALQLLHPGGAA